MRHGKIIALLAAGLTVLGCAKDPHNAASGTLDVTFSTDPSLKGVTMTRAAETPSGLNAPAASEFKLSITREGRLVDRYPTIPTIPVKLETGSYVATASWGDPDLEGFISNPAFVATSAFTITKNATTPVALTAGLAGMAVTVEYTDAFKGFFPTHSAVVLRNESPVASFEMDDLRVAYIKAEPFDLRIDYTYQFNGRETKTGSTSRPITLNIAPRNWLKIVIDAEKVGESIINIRYNDTVEKIDLGVVGVGEDE